MSGGETHVWAFDVDVTPPHLAELERLLAEDEVARADRFRFAQDRARFVAARGMLRQILGRYADRAPESLQFTYSAFGKPSLSPAMGMDRFRFNASASDALALIAVRFDGEVGVDVERIRSIPDALQLSRRMLNAQEYDELASLSETLRELRFLEHWVRQEALVKLHGLGIGSVHVSVEAGNRVIPIAAPTKEFVAALATREPVGTVQCWKWV